MFENVLFPMDFSRHSLKIIECLGEIPGIKEVIILHVVDTDKIAHMEDTQESLVKKAELKLAEYKTILQSMGFNVKTSVKVGIPSREIIRTAQEKAVSLIVMGARGRSLVRDILLGSVTSDVLRYGNSDVLIMRYRIIDQVKETEFEKYCRWLFHKVLCPTDFSTHAQQTLSIIKQIPDIGEIVLLNVVDKGDTAEELNRAVEAAETELRNVSDGLIRDGIKARYLVRVGESASEINNAAEEQDVSLIAMGSRGKGILEELMLGSTVERTVRHARRPVMVLRT